MDLGCWRGRGTDPDADPSLAVGNGREALARLRARSRALLANLLRPHRRRLAVAIALLLVQNAAGLAGPFLVMYGIDHAIAPLRADEPGPLVAVAAAFAAAAVVEYASKRGFLILSARIGQAVLLDLRQRVYGHFLRLHVAFHERYTSGLAVYSPGIKLVGNVTVAGVLTYGGWRVLEDRLDLGVLAAFLLYLRRFFEPMQELSQFYNSLQSATAGLEKLAGVLDERPGVAEPTHPRPLPVGGVRGAVRFRSVSFGYRPGVPILTDLDLEVPAGQTVALVGATGAGKSTVAKLLARFHDPDAGSVSLDGVDLRDAADAELRRAVVLATQENHLFSGTVAENIRFGRPDADDAAVRAAAQAVGADDFIAALPDGYATEVHRRGGRLSAGQRQLVAFARAFLADPAVLILDEATSCLDVPTEQVVQHALGTILRDRTALVIAHRLSTVRIADRVLVLDRGRIVEDGPPDRLVASDGRYARLHRQWRDSLA